MFKACKEFWINQCEQYYEIQRQAAIDRFHRAEARENRRWWRQTARRERMAAWKAAAAVQLANMRGRLAESVQPGAGIAIAAGLAN